MKKFFFYIALQLLLGPAFSQEMKFGAPVRLGDEINSAAEEINPLISPDGKRLFFVRVFSEENIGGKIAGSDIWVAEKNPEGSWSKASRTSHPWNTRGSDAVIGINENNDIVYLLNSYYKNKKGIAFSKFLNGKWTSPELIPIPKVEKSEFVGYYMNSSFNTLLISMSDADSFGQEDLYVSLRDSLGRWSAPLNLGSTINTAGFETAPFLSKDGKQLYFTSNGHPGLGDGDIFVAERLYKSWTVWTKPKNLGSPINSAKFDSNFIIASENQCFFSSNRESDLADIYQASILIERNDNFIVREEIKYMTPAEIKSLTDKDFNDRLFFFRNALDLSESNKNQLNALSNILLTQEHIHVRLVTRKASNADELDEYQKRLLNTLKYLKTAGIDGSRVTFGTENDSTDAENSGAFIRMKLYRPNPPVSPQ